MKNLLIWLLISTLTIGPLAAEARYALVIGNGSYTDISPLRNPANDAVDIASVLRQLDFDVEVLIDSDLREMRNGVRKLHRKLQADPESAGLFYFAGHGVQSQGNNYLIPVDADILTATDLEYEALSANYVLDYLNQSESSFNFIVLDACRDNPFSTFRSTSRGLAVVNAPKGSIVMYATGAGEVAADGSGRNGTFTESLLNYLGTPGMPVTEMVRQVMGDVSASTGGVQVPAFYSNYFGDFSFNSESVGTGTVQPRVMSSTVRPEIVVPAGLDLHPIEPVTSGIERLPGGISRPKIIAFQYEGLTYPVDSQSLIPNVLDKTQHTGFDAHYFQVNKSYEEITKGTSQKIFPWLLFGGLILTIGGFSWTLIQTSEYSNGDVTIPVSLSLIGGGSLGGAIGLVRERQKKLKNLNIDFTENYNSWLKNNN
jgi:Caspase domain